MSRLTTSDIQNILKDTPITSLPITLDNYRNDTRKSVIKLIKTYENKYNKYLDELQRLEKMKLYENKYKQYNYLCGIDEVGRGPLAGPVVTAAVILPKNSNILYINDSKKLSEKRRELLYDEIKKIALDISIGIESVETIDSINILQATYKAMQQSIIQLSKTPNIILVDAVTIPNIKMQQESIIQGDSKSISIAAASIIAKVTRDKIMQQYDKLYPEYNFAKNKGYGTKEHIEALKQFGECPIHRKSFIKNIISE